MRAGCRALLIIAAAAAASGCVRAGLRATRGGADEGTADLPQSEVRVQARDGRGEALSERDHRLVADLKAPPIDAGTQRRHVWSARYGGAAMDWARGVAVDSGGNIYITGELTGSLDFGGGPLISADYVDGFLASFSSAGQHRWSKRFGAKSYDSGMAVTVDSGGNVCMAGFTATAIDFGGGVLPSAGSFVACFASSSGAHLWSKGSSGVTWTSPSELASDSHGNLYVGGEFNATTTLAGKVLTSAGYTDVYLASFGPMGVDRWARRFGGAANDHVTGLAASAAGELFLTGCFEGPADFGGATVPVGGTSDVILASYGSDGAHRWSKNLGGSGFDCGKALAFDGAALRVTGFFMETAGFGGQPLISKGGADVFLASYDSNGLHQWSRPFGSTDGEEGRALATGAGHLLLAGVLKGPVDFGGGALLPSGSTNLFLADLDAQGAHHWSARFGPGGGCVPTAMTVDGLGRVIVVGSLAGSVDFGDGGLLTSAGGEDVFVAVLK